MKSTKNLSIGNLSSDSGCLEMDQKSTNGHSRSASNATSCYSTDTGYNEPKNLIKIDNDDNDNKNFNKNKNNLSRKNIFQINTKAWIILISFIISLLLCLCCAYLPYLVTRIIQTIINIRPGGEFYDFWLESSEPTEVGIHFFHIENPWEVENGLAKLKIKETGRYFFKQRFIREVSNFSSDNSTVNFIEKRYFYFDEHKTQLSLDENITVVNVPYAALSSIVPNYLHSIPFFDYFTYHGVNGFLESHNQSLFINTTIRQLLYGYRLNILDTAESYTNLFTKFGLDLMPSKLFPNNSFGILHGRNGTPDGPYEMYTGLTNTQNKFAYIKSWNNKTKVDFWKADSCNAINGTDGTMWPAGVSTEDRLDFFIPDVCRSLYVTFQEKSSYKGIPTYLFTASDQVLAGKYSNPENECFCIEEDEDLAKQRCIDGIFDLSGCQNGVPIIVSLPHFLGADKQISDEIIGLKPNPAKHRPELHIEPTMGLVIHGDSRLQMSIRVTPNENMIGFDKLRKEMYIPIFWGYKKLGMSDEMAIKLKKRLFIPVNAIKYTLLFLIFFGFIFSIFGFIRWIIFSNMVIRFSKDPESSKFEKNINFTSSELEQMMPRVESETSDLGVEDEILQNKSANGSLNDSPDSSVIELKCLVDSEETCI